MDGRRPASPRGARHRQAPQPPSSPNASDVHSRTGTPPLRPARGASTRMPGHVSRGSVHADPTVDELCRIETFQQGYSSKDFLAGLSEKLIARSKADPGHFNPRPFIRTFESSVDALIQLQGQMQSQMTTLSSSVRVSESAYTSKLHDLSSHFASASTSFTSLESRFSEVGRTAMHIGEQLQTIDRMRTRAAEAHDLIEYYYQFARGDTSKLERLRKEGGKEGRLRTAVIARRLSAIAREVDIEGAEQTRETIDRFAERFERDMLKLFDRFYRKSDPKMMSHIAKVLQSFNGGHSCVQIYVNQHDFFISKDRVVQRREVEQSAMWNAIADPEALPPKTEPSLQALFSEIRTTVEDEAQIISAVFPNPLLVMTTFLQRVFAQSVQGYVEVLMTKASEVGATSSGPAGVQGSGESNLAFLRALQMARGMSLQLVNDLKVYDFRGAGIVASSRADGLNGDSGGASRRALGDAGILAGTSAPGGSALSAVLDSAVEELFVPYMEGMKYLERESRSLTELYAAYLYRFTQYHRQAHQAKTTNLFDRVRTGITAGAGTSSPSISAASGVPGSAITAQGQQRGGFGFSKLTNLVDRARVAAGGTAVSQGDISMGDGRNAADSTLPMDGATAQDIEERDGDLSLDVAERMLRWHAEAIGRCVDLSGASDVAKNTFALLKVLADAFVRSYVETALESALARATSQDARSGTLPELRDMNVVRQADLIIQLWQHYINIALLPLAGSSVTVRREMVIYNNHLLLRVERACDAVVQRMTDNTITYLSSRLATQKKNDFTPKNDELAFSRINTDPCLACVDALEKVEQGARNGLGPGKNSEAFLLEIGVAFHSLLLDHLRKYTISAAGGIMLTKDLAMYQDAVSKFGLPALADRFEMLRQLGNLFIVQPAVLKSYMRESHLAKVEERLLRPYLFRRADYATHVRDLNDGPERSGSVSSASGLTAASTLMPTSASANGSSTDAPLYSGLGSAGSGNTSAPHSGNANSNEADRVERLNDVMADLARWSADDDAASINNANLRKIQQEGL